jgi:hypothetical protein
MGLADLKKNSTPSNRAQTQIIQRQHVNIEDFIDEATHYASGVKQVNPGMAEVFTLPTFVNALEPLSQLNTVDKWLKMTLPEMRKGHQPYRKATFTLSESAISHLAELASECDVAKSKLVRFLIEHYFSLNQDERQQKVSSIIVD